MKILVDTNVVLDVVLRRPLFFPWSARLLGKIERRQTVGLLAATSLTTLHYVATKYIGREQALASIETMLDIFEIASVDREILEGALTLGGTDFEDTVICAAALRSGAEAIVTRDPKGYGIAQLPIHSPQEMLEILGST